MASVLAALAGLALLAYYGVHCHGRHLTRREDMVAILILLSGLSTPFWLF